MTGASNEILLEESSETPDGLTSMLMLAARRIVQRAFGWPGRANKKPQMELLETLQLGGKRQLMLVRCNGQGFLVGAGGENIHSIVEVRLQLVGASCLPFSTCDSISEPQRMAEWRHAEPQGEHVR
jgi:hypothetical protein